MVQYYAILAVCTAMLAAGLAAYWALLFRYKTAFEYLPFNTAIFDLISHLPDAKSGPSLHVMGTVLFVSGACIFLALISSDFLTSGPQLLSTVFAVGSILLSIAFSVISMGTLWQTRRIDFQAGYKIADFHDLIAAANKEIEKVLASYRSYDFTAQPFHCFYLVTTQPFFGMVSYPASEETANFKTHLQLLAEYTKKPSPFSTNMICGDESAIKKLHQDMINRLRLQDGVKRAKIEEYDREAEDGIQKLEAAAAKGVVTRQAEVPPVQFMIIGSRLFEFTLESSGPQSEIFNTQVITDTRYSTAYMKMFDILKRQGRLTPLPGGKSQAAE